MRIVFAALLYYDYTLTLSMEYEQFWKQQKRLSLVAVLIVLNRYVSLLGEIPVIIFIFGNLDGEVSIVVLMSKIVDVLRFLSQQSALSLLITCAGCLILFLDVIGWICTIRHLRP